MRLRLLTITALVASATLLSGCGKGTQPTPPNAVSSPGGRPLDAGILKDQTTYQPAGFTGGGAPAGGGGGGVEESAIRAMFREGTLAWFNLDIDKGLAMYEPGAIAPLIEQKSALIETSEKLQAAWRLIEPKLPAEIGSAISQLLTVLHTQLPGAIVGAITVDVLSPTHATITVDEGRMKAALAAALGELTPAIIQLAGGAAAPTPAAAGDTVGDVVSEAPPPAGAGGDPGAAMAMLAAISEQLAQPATSPPQVLPLNKSDGVWRIALPRPMTSAEGEVIAESLSFVNEALDKLMEKVQSVEQLAPADLVGLGRQLMFEMLPRFAELQAKLAALQQAAAPAPAPGEEGGGDDSRFRTPP